MGVRFFRIFEVVFFLASKKNKKKIRKKIPYEIGNFFVKNWYFLFKKNLIQKNHNIFLEKCWYFGEKIPNLLSFFFRTSQKSNKKYYFFTKNTRKKIHVKNDQNHY